MTQDKNQIGKDATKLPQDHVPPQVGLHDGHLDVVNALHGATAPADSGAMQRPRALSGMASCHSGGEHACI